MLDIFWTVLSKFLKPALSGKFGKERPIILIGSLLLSLFVYYQTIPKKDNVLNHLVKSVTGESYVFQGGSAQGTYYKIGLRLKESAKEGQLTEVVENSKGAAGVLGKLVEESDAFGIVQEDVLYKEEITAEQVRIIAPLYDERLHILYRIDKWNQITGGQRDPYERVRLTRRPDPDVVKLLEESRVRIAASSPKSGASSLASSVLEVCDIFPKRPVYASMADALQGLADVEITNPQAIDVACIVAGAPNANIAEYIKKQRSERKIGLISIQGDVLRTLNSLTKANYRMSRFTDIYHPDFDNVSTISSRAILVASKDIADAGIRDILELVKREKDKDYGVHNPLSEYEFIEREIPVYPTRAADNVRMWGGFLILTLGLFAVISMSLTWVISSSKRILYSQDVTKIYKDKLPSHVGLSEEGSVPRPNVKGDNKEIISEIIRGISALLDLAMTVRDDYDSGGIMVTHQKHLLDNIYFIKNIFVTHLGQRLNHAIEGKEIEITQDELSDYYTASYLSAYDYHSLRRRLASIDRNEPITGMDTKVTEVVEEDDTKRN